jgi:hypothetical protein
MAKEKTPGQQQTTGNSPSPSTATPQNTSVARKSTRSGHKGYRAQIGGTAVPGAKSTQPKQISTSNNPQQQEMESANRTTRRRMEHLGTGPQSSEQVQATRNRRQERVERLKERQKAEISAVKRSLPGGKLVTDTSRVYYLIGGVAAAILVLILLFVVLRVAGVIH